MAAKLKKRKEGEGDDSNTSDEDEGDSEGQDVDQEEDAEGAESAASEEEGNSELDEDEVWKVGFFKNYKQIFLILTWPIGYESDHAQSRGRRQRLAHGQ